MTVDPSSASFESHSGPSKEASSAPRVKTEDQVSITLVQRDCPSCGKSSSSSVKKVFSEPTAEEADFEKVSDSWQQFFKAKVFFTYAECKSCGLLYCPTYFSQASIQAMYSHMTDNTASVPIQVLMRTIRWYKNFQRKYAKRGGVSAEFGPDIGLLAGLTAQEQLYSSFVFLEPNLAVHSRLEASVKPFPAVIYSDLEAYREFPDAQLNHVNMIHVLDHMLEPLPVLQALKSKMSPGATIMAVVHNRSSVLARLLGRAWPPYCLQHPQLFNPETLRELLEKGGYRVKTVRRTVNVFPVNYLLNHLFYALGFKSLKAPKWLSFAIPLFLGNIVIVAEA